MEDRKYPKNNNKCLKEKDNKCVLCSANQYPHQFQVFTITTDIIEAYAVHKNEDKIANCIVYNSVLLNCERCETNYRLNPTSKQCQICNT